MLRLLIIPPEEGLYDEVNNRFIELKPTIVHLEHSLHTIWKWEKIHHKAFIKNYKDSSTYEKMSYIKCMTMDEDIDDNLFLCLTSDDIQQINDYIASPMTAIHYRTNEEDNTQTGVTKEGDVITAELIMYWMIKFQIWPEAQYWHLNSLLALIHVCGIKESPDKKKSQSDINAHHRAVNKARRAKARKGRV